MKKTSIFVLIALALALAVSPVIARASASAERSTDHVGLVTAYTPNESITIMNKDGAEYTFTIASDVKIVPKNRAESLGVGSYVTIISPNNPGNGGSVATGIVVHPQVPNGFTMPDATDTPLPSATSTTVSAETMTESPTFTETATATSTATETTTATETSTGEVPTETATATATGTAANPQAVTQSFIQWLASLFNQFLGSNG